MQDAVSWAGVHLYRGAESEIMHVSALICWPSVFTLGDAKEQASIPDDVTANISAMGAQLSAVKNLKNFMPRINMCCCWHSVGLQVMLLASAWRWEAIGQQ